MAHTTAADGGKVATGTFRATVANSVVGAPQLLFFLVSLFVSVGSSRWQGEEQPPAALGADLYSSESKRKAWDGLAWVAPLQVGAGGARGQPLFSPPHRILRSGVGQFPTVETSVLVRRRERDAG